MGHLQISQLLPVSSVAWSRSWQPKGYARKLAAWGRPKCGMIRGIIMNSKVSHPSENGKHTTHRICDLRDGLWTCLHRFYGMILIWPNCSAYWIIVTSPERYSGDFSINCGEMFPIGDFFTSLEHVFVRDRYIIPFLLGDVQLGHVQTPELAGDLILIPILPIGSNWTNQSIGIIIAHGELGHWIPRYGPKHVQSPRCIVCWMDHSHRAYLLTVDV